MKKEVDSGSLIKASYMDGDYERYDLHNGNSYFYKFPFTSNGVNQGANIKIYETYDGLVADWGNLPLSPVTKQKKNEQDT